MFFLQIIGSMSQGIAMSIQPDAANLIYWVVVLGASSLATMVLYESIAGKHEERLLAEDNNEDQVLRQAA